MRLHLSNRQSVGQESKCAKRINLSAMFPSTSLIWKRRRHNPLSAAIRTPIRNGCNLSSETGVLDAEETVKRLKTEVLQDQWTFHTELSPLRGGLFGFVGSNAFEIGFLPFGIYITILKNFYLKMRKILIKPRLFRGASFGAVLFWCGAE